MKAPQQPLNAVRRMSPLILMTLATVGLAQVAPPPEEPSAPPPPDKEEVIVLNPFEVKASSNVGYRAESTASSGRYVQAYVDIPQTVDVITSEFMRDFNLTDSRKALSYVPNVFITSLINDGVTAIRGTTVNAIYIDGMAVASGAFGSYTLSTDFFERLEVVKGPSSAAFGLGQPGGIINFITKKPQGIKRTSLLLSVGDHNNYRSVLDTQGVKGKFSYRLVLSGSSGDDAVKVLHSESLGAHLALKYQISPRDTLQLITSYNDLTFPYAQTPAWFHSTLGAQANGYLPYPGQPDPAIALPRLVPKDEWSIAPGWNESVAKPFRTNLIYDHQFSEHVSIRNSLTVDNIKMDLRGYLTAGALQNPSPGLYRIPALLIWWPYESDAVRDTLDCVAKYDAFGAHMTTLAGGEVYHFNSDLNNFQIGLPFNDNFTSYAVDIYDGQHNATSPGSPRNYLGKLAAFGIPEWISTKNLADDNTGYGFYVQQEASFLQDRLTLMGAWRIDYLDYSNTNRNATPNVVHAPGWQNTGGAPRGAISFKPRPWMSVYALYTEHKDPTLAQTRWNWGGSVPPPVSVVADPNEVLYLQPKGYTEEIGVKALLFKDKVGVSVASFRAVNSGQTVPANNGQQQNPDGTTTFWSENIEVSSVAKGLELTVAGQIGDRLVMTASYARTYGTAPGSAVDAQGNNFNFVKRINPPTTVGIHGKYDFGRQPGKGLYATFGAIWYSPFWFAQQKSNNGGPPLNFYWDSWQYSADVGLGYVWGQKRKQHLVLSANNVTNQLVSLSDFVSGNHSELPLRKVWLSYMVEF